MIADRRIYLDREQKFAVEQGDPRAAILLVGAGGFLADEIAKKFGVAVGSTAAVAEDARPSAPPPVSYVMMKTAEIEANAAELKRGRGRPRKTAV